MFPSQMESLQVALFSTRKRLLFTLQGGNSGNLTSRFATLNNKHHPIGQIRRGLSGTSYPIYAKCHSGEEVLLDVFKNGAWVKGESLDAPNFER